MRNNYFFKESIYYKASYADITFYSKTVLSRKRNVLHIYSALINFDLGRNMTNDRPTTVTMSNL